MLFEMSVETSPDALFVNGEKFETDDASTEYVPPSTALQVRVTVVPETFGVLIVSGVFAPPMNCCVTVSPMLATEPPVGLP